jgi:DNA invertase Pin-like site-specific DNA recombinase
VIYVRFSSELQRTESNTDQERRCREALVRMGIPPERFIVIGDEALRGTSESRPGFDQLKALIYSGRLGILISTEQSRLSRGDNIKSLIKDLVFHGGRFISVTEGVDTTRKGWKTIVGISEIHHSHSNEDTAERVRGGQEGRVRDGNGSAGDYCYGYTSEFEDPAAAAAYRFRGPKPKRIVVVEAVAAAVVQEVHRRFAIALDSMNAIVRWWNEHLSEFPSITLEAGAPIRIDHIRRILKNEKYIGNWNWGRTTTLYDGPGNKKQAPARPDQTVTSVQRPTLRIVDQETWDKTQARLAQLKEIYGMKADAAKRGPTVHYRLLYEKSLLGGKMICSECKARLLVASRKGEKRLVCPNHRQGKCPMGVSVPYLRAEQAVLSVISEMLGSYPEWLRQVAQATRSSRWPC